MVGSSATRSASAAAADGDLRQLRPAFLRGVTLDSIYPPSRIPLIVLIAYQMMFAIITPALITGAFTNRVTFKAYLIFLVVWQLFVYFPFVHMVWGGGILAQWGVLDFAGGIVVHAIGRASRRSPRCSTSASGKFVDAPHNIPLVALGTGLLWFGWYGFNAGSELKVDSITAVAFLNTDIAASFAAVTWLFIEWWHAQEAEVRRPPDRRRRRPGDDHAGGRLRPDLRRGAHRRSSPGVVCYYAVALKNRLQLGRRARRLGRARRRRMLGIVLLGVFANTASTRPAASA